MWLSSHSRLLVVDCVIVLVGARARMVPNVDLGTCAEAGGHVLVGSATGLLHGVHAVLACVLWRDERVLHGEGLGSPPLVG